MSMNISYTPYTFYFNFPGGTSRGVLTQKQSWFIKVSDSNNQDIFGIGEVSILPGLSPETPEKIEHKLNDICKNPHLFTNNTEDSLKGFPAVRFGLETALLDLKNSGNRILYPSEFTSGKKRITINGLVWMGEHETMLERIKEKIEQGFTCIKIKVGAIDFEQELSLLKYIRKEYSAQTLEIRVDANGAFTTENALERMSELAKFHVHSIEQPIKHGQWYAMAKLCSKTPLPIALDEELIGIEDTNRQMLMLNVIKPQYIVIKPSLIGGLVATDDWAQLATQLNIGWWVTSALEGNIGLNAIAQWTAVNGSNMPQGLGTGQVFSNNIQSPLEIRKKELWYSQNSGWDITGIV